MLRRRRLEGWNWQFEFEPRDLWIGVRWKRGGLGFAAGRLDVWIVVVPMFPLHLWKMPPRDPTQEHPWVNPGFGGR